jgi:hypothetical protein
MLKNEEALGHFLGGDKHGSTSQVPCGVDLCCLLFLLEAEHGTHMCNPGKRREKKILTVVLICISFIAKDGDHFFCISHLYIFF